MWTVLLGDILKQMLNVIKAYTSVVVKLLYILNHLVNI
jgi:hypothetical protein